MKQRKQLLNSLGCFSPHLSQHLLRLLLLLVTAIGGVGSSWAEDVVLKTIDFTSSEWAGKTFSQGSSKTADVINGITFYSSSADNQFSIVAEAGGTPQHLQGSSNMSTSNYFIAIPVSGINGSVTITVVGEARSTFRYSVDNSTATVPTSNNATTAKDQTSGISYVTKETSNTDATIFVGLQSSSYKKIYSITITTPAPLPTVTSIKTVEGTTTTWNFGGLTTDHLDYMKALSPAWEAEGDKAVKIPTVSEATYWTPSWCEGIQIGANQNADGTKVRLFASNGSYPGFYLGGGAASMFVTIPAGANTLTVTSATGIRSNTSGVTFTLKTGTTNVYVAKVTAGSVVEIRRASGVGSNSISIVQTSYVEPTTYTVSFNVKDNGGAIADLTESAADAGVVLPAATPNAGLTFLGWSESANATTPSYYVGQNYKPATDVTLYAVYRSGLPIGSEYTPFWKSFSDFVSLGVDKAYRARFTNVGNAAASYKNWLLIATNNNTGHNGDANLADGSNEFFCYGADGNTWGGKVGTSKMYRYDGAKYVEYTAKNDATFTNDMASGNATVDLTVSRSNKRVYIYVTTVCANGAKYVGTYSSGETGAGDLYLSFTTENSQITEFAESNNGYVAYEVKTSGETNGTADILSAEGVSIKSHFVRSGSTVSFTATPNTDYTFKNWTGTDYVEVSKNNPYETTVSSALNLTPNFEAIPSNHTITFNANGGKGTMDPQQVEDNVATAINANTFSGVNAATNFVGWNTAEDGSGTDYAPGAEITLTDDIVLYAQWFRFAPQGSQTPTVVVGDTKQGYQFIFTSTKNLNISASDFEVSSSSDEIATAAFRDLTGGVRINVTGVSAGTANITVKFKGRAGTLYGEASPVVTFTVKAADIETSLLTIEDQQVFELTNTDKNFRGYEWINIANQSDRISLEDGSNTNVSFTSGATYITDDRYFYLHAGSGDRLEDSGFDGLKLNGNPSASSGHYLEMDVHGSGKLTLEVWNNNDRTIVISESNTFDDASIIATQEHTASTDIKTYEIIVNNQGTRHLFLGSKGGALRIGTFKWEPFAKPALTINPTSATINVNDASKKVSDLTTMTPTIASSGAAISNPVYKYRSSNPEIATVDENTGAITPVAVGQTTITIQLQSDGSTHGAQTAELVLTVEGTKKQNVSMSFSGNLAFTTSDFIPHDNLPILTIKNENSEVISLPVTYTMEAGTTGLYVNANTGKIEAGGTYHAGTATVTATFAGNDIYNSATATYTITITTEAVVAPVITLTANGGESSFSVLAAKLSKESSKTLTYNDATEVYVLKNYLDDNKKVTSNYVYVAIETAQANATIKYYTSTSGPANEASTFNSDKGIVYATPVSMKSDRNRFICIEVTVGSEKWYGYYKLTSISEPTITIYGENAPGVTSRKVSLSGSADSPYYFYTTDGAEPTKSSTQYQNDFILTQSKVVKSVAMYPGTKFADGKEFYTISTTKSVFIYDPTIFMADASAADGTMAKAIKNGYKHELNDGKLVVTFGNNGKYYNSEEGEYKKSLLNAYASEKDSQGNKVLLTDADGNYYEGDQNATNESSTIPSYVDVYTDRQMFNGDNPKREDGGYADMGQENGGSLFKTPVGGVMYRFEPKSNGIVTFWARQNGSLNYDETKTDVNDGYSVARRPVYIMDEDGVYLRRNTNEEFTDIKQINGVEAHISNLSTFGTDPANAMKYFKEHHPEDANYKYFADKYGDNIKATDKIGDIIYSETEAEAGGVPMYGWECPEKNYVRYSFPVKAGKTYYLGGKTTKVGFCAVKFDAIDTNPTDVTIDHKSTVGLPSMTVGQQYNVTLNRKFTAGKWNALVLPFSVSETQLAEVFGEGVEVMFFEEMPNNNTFKVLRHFYQMVYANVPCLVRPSSDVSNPVFTNVTYAGGVIREQDILNGFKVTGSYKVTTVNQYDYVTSWDNTYDLTFFQAASSKEENRKWNATRGWITSSNPAQNLAPRVMSIGLGAYDGDDEATYIETIFNGSILDGSYAPVNNVRAGVYNISGQKIADTVDNLPAGIYVVNGKKVIVK